MNWCYIIVSTCIVVSTIGFIYRSFLKKAAYINLVLLLSIGIIFCIAQVRERQVFVYERQKATIAEYNYNKQIEYELNDWYYKAIYRKTKYKGFSLYPDKVLSLTFIKENRSTVHNIESPEVSI